MMTPDINPVELKVFLNHIYELKKGVRSDGVVHHEQAI